MTDQRIFTFRRTTGDKPREADFAARLNEAISRAAKQPTSLFVHRTGSSFTSYFSVSESAAKNNAQLGLAQAFGSRVVPVEDGLPEDLVSTPHVLRLKYVSAEYGHDTQYGVDPSSMARSLSQSMPEGSWVGFSVRRSRRVERQRNRASVDHRLGGPGVRHSSKQGSAKVFSVFVGAQSVQEARELASALPSMMVGFDLDTRPVTVPRFKTSILAWFGLAALSLILGFYAPSLPEPAGVLGEFSSQFMVIALVLAVAGGVHGFFSSPSRRLRSALSHGRLPSPEGSPVYWQSPRKEQVVRSRNSEGETRERHLSARSGSYPLAKTAFLFEPTVFATAANPNGSSFSGAVSSSERDITPELAQATGPVVGSSNTGEPVVVPAEATRYGTLLLGAPGSGKSVTLQGIWSWFCAEKSQPSGRKDHPGSASALIAFEMKGGAAVDSYRLHSAVQGNPAVVIDAVDESTPAVDPFYFGENVTMFDRAERTVSALIYAFSDGAIMGRSAEALRMVYHLGYVAQHYDLVNEDWMGEEHTRRPFEARNTTVHDWAWALLGANAEVYAAVMETLGTLAERLRREGDVDAYEEITEALDSISPLTQMSDSARRNYGEAARNKMDALRRMRWFFTTSRRQLTFDEILSQHRSVIINMGSSGAGQIDEEQAKTLSSLLAFGLRSAIQRVCADWFHQGQTVAVFCDEISMLAGSSGEVLEWFRDQGRSFGLRLVFASQRPEQFERRLQHSLFSYATVISYQAPGAVESKVLADELGDAVTADELQAMPKHVALVRTRVDDQLQPIVSVKMHNFEADIADVVIAEDGGRR